MRPQRPYGNQSTRLKEVIVLLSLILVTPLFTSFTIAGVCFMLTRSIRRTIFSAAWLSSLLPILATLALYPTLPVFREFYYVVTWTLVMFSYLLTWMLFAREVFQNPDISKRPNRIRRSVINTGFTFILLADSLVVLFCLVPMVHDRCYPWNPAFQHNSERFRKVDVYGNVRSTGANKTTL